MIHKIPINNNEFSKIQAPEPAEPWFDVFDATSDGPMCPQPNKDENDMSEDCLRLNVYTVKIYLE